MTDEIYQIIAVVTFCSLLGAAIVFPDSMDDVVVLLFPAIVFSAIAAIAWPLTILVAIAFLIRFKIKG